MYRGGMGEQTKPYSLSDRFEPYFLARLAWKRKRILAVCAGAGLLIGFLVALITPAVYQVYMIVGPAEPVGGISRSSSGLVGDLAAITGIGIASPNEEQLEQYRLLMTGSRVAGLMERRYHALRTIIPDAWNEKENRWKRRDEINLGLKGTIKDWLGMTHYQEPNASMLSELLAGELQFTSVRKSDFEQISIRTPHRNEGIELLDELHRTTNEIYMQDLAAQAAAQIDYIDQALKTETRDNVRAAQMRALDQYSNQLITLHSGQSLFVQYVQPPVSMSSQIWPKPALMMLIGTVIGLMVGLVAALLWPLDVSMRGVLWDRPVHWTGSLLARLSGR